jgi:hypothetical protein
MFFIQIIRDSLGPFVAILEFTASRPGWITVFFACYLGMYGAAKLQLANIKKKTNRLIEERYKSWLVVHSGQTEEELFERFYPFWEAELKKTRYLFVLNKNDLWPVSVTPKNVLAKFPLSPAYVHQHLLESGIIESKEQEELPQTET